MDPGSSPGLPAKQVQATLNSSISSSIRLDELGYSEYLSIKNEINELKLTNSTTNKKQRGIGSISAKVAKQLLIKNKSKIANLLRKLPNGSRLSSIFLDRFNVITNALDRVTEGVEGAIRGALMKVGFSYFWADLLADAIMTILGFFI